MPTITSILADIKKLSEAEQNDLKRILMSKVAPGMTTEKFVKENRFADGRTCPYCGGTHIRRHGFNANG